MSAGGGPGAELRRRLHQPRLALRPLRHGRCRRRDVRARRRVRPIRLRGSGAVIEALREHGGRGTFPDRDAGALRRPVADRGQRRGVRRLDRCLLRRHQLRQGNAVSRRDRRVHRRFLRRLRSQPSGRIAPVDAVDGFESRRLHDRHHAHGRRRSELGLDDDLARLDVPVGDCVGACVRRTAGGECCREGDAPNLDPRCVSHDRSFPMRCRASAPVNDDFEVLARHDHGAVSRAVELRGEREQIALERRLRVRRERSEGLEHRTVVGLEDLQPMLG